MKLSERSSKILTSIANGYSYEQILSMYPTYTYKDIFLAAQEALDLSTNSKPHSTYEDRLQKIKQQYHNAYLPWDEKQEELLANMHKSGASVNEIASALKRQPGAISSRLRKLGLEEKD